MRALDLEKVAATAQAAADLARAETLSRFRSVAVETKSDGTPVTEADRAAERVIRKHLQQCFPEFSILGEEYGAEGRSDGPEWIIDPIDGTLGFSRGIPLFSTLIALAIDGEPVMGLIDLPALDERYVGWKGGGCRRNGKPTRVSSETDLQRAIISHGDPFCFDERGERRAFERMAREIPILRGYTDAFGYAQVLGGGIGAMLDMGLRIWDVAPVQILVPEAGGRCVTLSERDGKLGLVVGNPSLVDQLMGYLSDTSAERDSLRYRRGTREPLST
jgi:histidinol phosphatase-like enzyme (inositol monophosphatase family)